MSQATLEALDLTGGFAPEMDLIDPAPPKGDPTWRESVSMWLFDDAGVIQFPRFLIEDVPQEPDRRVVFYNIAFPDGRAVVEWGHDAPAPTLDEAGKPTIYGSKAMQFRCIEPFKRWTASLRSPMTVTTNRQLMTAVPEGPRVDVEFDAETTSVVPPWISGRFNPAVARMIAEGGQDSHFMGVGFRYEQLVLAKGRCRIGEDTYEFSGRGLRVHRRSRRNTVGFRGHVWATTVFPSGKAFGVLAYPPEKAGAAHFWEAFYFDGAVMHPAEMGGPIPWLTRAVPGPQDVSFSLRVGGREVLVGAEIQATNFSVARAAHSNRADPMLQQQSCARYVMEGEAAFGMMERSYPGSRITLVT